MNPCSKRKTKSLSLKEIQKITYTYDTSEDESEEEDKEEIDNTPNAETVANNELEDPAPILDIANIPDTSVELGIIHQILRTCSSLIMFWLLSSERESNIK